MNWPSPRRTRHRTPLAVHKQAFADAGLDNAWSRVVGLVVQPGVEFDNLSVIDYGPAKARDLAQWRRQKAENIVFEAHSTDFQRDVPMARW